MNNSEETCPENKEEEQFREHRQRRSSFWTADRQQSDLLKFRKSSTKWQLGPIFSERLFHGYDKPQRAYISEVSATCVATQVDGLEVGVQAILKIRKQ
jgi:hypothetical protein